MKYSPLIYHLKGCKLLYLYYNSSLQLFKGANCRPECNTFISVNSPGVWFADLMAHLFIVVKAHIEKLRCVSSGAWMVHLQFCWMISFHGRLLDGEMRFLVAGEALEGFAVVVDDLDFGGDEFDLRADLLFAHGRQGCAPIQL